MERAAVIHKLVAERRARRGQGDLLDVLEELPRTIPGPSSEGVLDELRNERVCCYDARLAGAARALGSRSPIRA